jgi:hypothetical protein
MQRTGGAALGASPPTVRYAPLSSSSSNPAPPPTRRPFFLQPRVLVFFLLVLTLAATFLSYMLFIGVDDGWTIPLPFYPPTNGDGRIDNKNNWLARPNISETILGEMGHQRTTLETDAMSVYSSCHNTVQGRKLVTDDAGAICARQNVLKNGCCRSTQTIDRLSCGMCRTDIQCCRSYEYCVSCCLSKLPDSDHATESIENAPHRYSFHSFDKCLHLCRTSSRSIKHGNMYRTAVLRHCYTEGEHALPVKFEDSATVLVAKQGVSCSRACAAYRGPQPQIEEAEEPGVELPPPAAAPLFICHEAFLPLINKCETMQKHFQCNQDKCDMNAGNDQPAIVVSETLPVDFLKQPVTERSKLPRGQCLLNGDKKLFDCEGHHESTQRLCVCIEADRAE